MRKLRFAFEKTSLLSNKELVSLKINWCIEVKSTRTSLLLKGLVTKHFNWKTFQQTNHSGFRHQLTSPGAGVLRPSFHPSIHPFLPRNLPILTIYTTHLSDHANIHPPIHLSSHAPLQFIIHPYISAIQHVHHRVQYLESIQMSNIFEMCFELIATELRETEQQHLWWLMPGCESRFQLVGKCVQYPGCRRWTRCGEIVISLRFSRFRMQLNIKTETALIQCQHMSSSDRILLTCCRKELS